ncbi:MAG TPA: SRPBCC family protein [Acidimicrobiales bacterium]|nr:SRPBCC family protein [Acidimicrobiales bacterium]
MNLGDSVTVHVDADVMTCWNIAADVTRIGELSPETFEAEWLDGATAPAVGAKFRGHVKRNGIGPIYWSPCVVTKCEPGEVFEFAVGSDRMRVNNWGYKFEAKAGGTDVTEYFFLEPSTGTKLYWRLLGWARGKTNREGMTQTLQRLKAIAEDRS